jgi:hypothetical protein
MYRVEGWIHIVFQVSKRAVVTDRYKERCLSLYRGIR